MKRIHGFTLVELLVTLAVFAIFMTFAIPGFKSVIQNARLQGAAVNVVTALNLTRSEAIKRGQAVDIKATDGNSWTNGITVVPDSGGNALRSYPAFANGITVTINPAATSISYLASGLINPSTAETFTVCDSTRSGETGRSISINVTGRILTTNITCP